MRTVDNVARSLDVFQGENICYLGLVLPIVHGLFDSLKFDFY